MPSSDGRRHRKVTPQQFLDRWGGEKVLFHEGYLPVPVTFLRCLGQLSPHNLKPAEALFLLELLVFKWDEEDPWPSYGKVAERMGVSDTYARRLARKLEKKGFLERKKRIGRTNAFNLDPLFEKLAAHLREEKGIEEQPEEESQPEPEDEFSEDFLMGLEDDLPF